ncbi:MAG: hypothetical protein JOZ10_08315 [Acidobacteria bacterium]|nr:hypothetical protein [Acidobacteriota bacterium]MBV9147060.1 hypothetical protein [Acidobacteriota bacterium]MBV9436380.1 hypothetical protein [Acidobacteriota bacterium]
MRTARKAEHPVLHVGDRVPESGIYQVLHGNCTSQVLETILVRNHLAPRCELCGSSARYQLLRSVPHISEDSEFEDD